jgi:hypothetical protein
MLNRRSVGNYVEVVRCGTFDARCTSIVHTRQIMTLTTSSGQSQRRYGKPSNPADCAMQHCDLDSHATLFLEVSCALFATDHDFSWNCSSHVYFGSQFPITKFH